MGALYEISFPSGKSYIGITTKTVHRRLLVHLHHVRKGRPHAIHRAFRKYGIENAQVRTLVIADDWKFLCDLERRAIAAYGTRTPGGYNMTDGGEGTLGYVQSPEQREKNSARNMGRGKGIATRPKGWKHTDDAREKIAEAGRGRVFTEERKAKIGASKLGNKYSLGKPVTPERRAKISAALKGNVIFTDERKRNMSASKKGKPWSEAQWTSWRERMSKKNALTSS